MISREQKKRRFTPNEIVSIAAAAVAVVAGLFSLVVSILLIANYVQIQAVTPLDNPELLKLRQQLAAAPEADPNLVEQIRTLDLLTRKAFFTSQDHLHIGGYLLLGGAALFLAAWRLAARCKPRLPLPDAAPPAKSYWASRSKAGQLVAFAGVLWIGLALCAAFAFQLDFPGAAAPASPTTAEQPAAQKAAPAYPTWDVVQQNWPSFRGPGGYGVAHYTTAPTQWDGASSTNIKWRTEVPLPGNSSPVVWGNRVFLSGATETTREVYCFDTETGQILWKNTLDKLPGTPEKTPKVSEDTGYAPSTLVAHGDRVCALFANGDMVCYDFDGAVKWAKNLGVPDNHYGHSSSLIAYENLVFVQYDQNSNGRLFALDLGDGHEVWTVARDKISWASPICAKTSFGFELVVDSEKDLDAYDPLTGSLLWKIECLDGEVAPSAAYNNDMFFVANDNAMATAIRLKPNEQPPKPEKVWEWDEALPDIASPVATDQHFYIATSRAQIACLERETGKMAWGQDYDEGFSASPILVGDRVYATDVKGTTFVFKVGPTYELIATSPLGENVGATPAFMDNRIYLRTEKNLLCIANANGS